MERIVIQPRTTHRPFAAYSHAIVVEGARRLVFCAGQVSADSEGNIVGKDDFDVQAEQVIRNLRAVLEEAGATMADVVKITNYVVRREDAPKAREVINKHFAGAPPASTLCVLQGLAHPEFLIEIEAIAAVS